MLSPPCRKEMDADRKVNRSTKLLRSRRISTSDSAWHTAKDSTANSKNEGPIVLKCTIKETQRADSNDHARMMDIPVSHPDPAPRETLLDRLRSFVEWLLLLTWLCVSLHLWGLLLHNHEHCLAPSMDPAQVWADSPSSPVCDA
uniref:KASH domain-containing protein n=1 Tax=Steinernema glaseri TaxID=37863 RepID=A0A1I8A511_9BILA